MADMVEDWSLQAIVRGSSGDYGRIVDMEMEGQDDDPFMGFRQGFDGLGFLDIINGSNDELENLYKPFVSGAPNYSLPAQAVIDFQEQIGNNVVGSGDGDQKQGQDRQSEQSSGSSSAGSVARVSSSAAAYSPKYKRRKNQHKRVVIQVTAEGLSSDMWAWRKYGQKPIKGSPYPRSYYRCSSSKGCLARKQVEQSCTDPGMFILTYTAEHSHSQPTRRNSLAGTVRQKFPSSKSTIKQEIKHHHHKINPNKADVDLHHQQALRIKEETKDYEMKPPPATTAVNNNTNVNNEDYGMSEFEFNEDFFSGLEEFDDFISELGATPAVCTHHFPLRSCS